MKKKLLIILFSICSLLLFGQTKKSFQLGIGIYPNIGFDYISPRNSEETVPKLGIGTGFQCLFPSKSKFNIGLELNVLKTRAVIENYYTTRGQYAAGTRILISESIGTLDVNQVFLQIPLYLRYTTGTKHKIFFDLGIDYKYVLEKHGSRDLTVTEYFPTGIFPLVEEDRLDEPLVYQSSYDRIPTYDYGVGVFFSIGWKLVFSKNLAFDCGLRVNNGAAIFFDKFHNPKFRNIALLIVYRINKIEH